MPKMKNPHPSASMAISNIVVAFFSGASRRRRSAIRNGKSRRSAPIGLCGAIDGTRHPSRAARSVQALHRRI
jgi:hypothetical protein